MIDPNDVIKYDRTRYELEEFLMFCILVAGKNSWIQAEKLDAFLFPLEYFYGGATPFDYIRHCLYCNTLLCNMQEHKLGQYSKLAKGFVQILKLNLETCTVEDLEAIDGIGPKTARFYVMMTRRDQRYAILDTHILRWMNETFGIDTPHTTPNGGRYANLERLFLEECDNRGLKPNEFDLAIWTQQSNKPKEKVA